jgi:hypothetical protein
MLTAIERRGADDMYRVLTSSEFLRLTYRYENILDVVARLPPALKFRSELEHAWKRMASTGSARQGISVNCQNGQLKLLLSELDVLSERCLTEPETMIYVGAAPGIHIPVLLELWPKLRIRCWDAAPYGRQITEYATRYPERLELNTAFYTDAVNAVVAAEGKSTIFVCDMRRGADDDKVFEDNVAVDLAAMARWIRVLSTAGALRYAFVKFRVPFTQDAQFFDGAVILQAFTSPVSAETRMLIEPRDVASNITWDTEMYQRFMYAFNLARATHKFRGSWETPVCGQGTYDDSAFQMVVEKTAKAVGRSEREVVEVMRKYVPLKPQSQRRRER